MIIVLLIGVIVFQYILNYKPVDRLEKQAEMERIKADFAARQHDNRQPSYDSVYAKDGTVSFYRNGSYLGKTVVTKN